MRWQVPEWHCIPGKDGVWDGRVGTWPNEELVAHLVRNKHAVVSNEWDPFSLDKLRISDRQLDGTPMKKSPEPGPRLLFVTTLRDPLDRLLSAYTFFAITAEGKYPSQAGPFREWDWIGGKGGLRSSTARHNHVAWRFSGGGLTQPEEWKVPFGIAIRALCQHDLVLPMDVMTGDEGREALGRLLGWKRFGGDRRRVEGDKKGGPFVTRLLGWKRFGGDRRQVEGAKKRGPFITRAGIKNSNAREYFSKEEYRELWEGNWLDNILLAWCRAVFLARLRCGDAIA